MCLVAVLATASVWVRGWGQWETHCCNLPIVCHHG